jgi:plasmid stability protein
VANLTITVDDDTLKRARIRAIERGESVNQFLAQRLTEYAGEDEARLRRQRAADDFVELSRELSGSTGGRGWIREELYDHTTEADQ